MHRLRLRYRERRVIRRLRTNVAIGFTLVAALSACDLPTIPIAGPADGPTGGPGLPWPPPIESAAGCDLYLRGVVLEGTAGRAVADASVTWRHFAGGAFDVEHDLRSDSNGRYNVCVPRPLSIDCESGACAVKYEVRAWKSAYEADSTSVVAEYNYWDVNDFRVPDLHLLRQ